MKARSADTEVRGVKRARSQWMAVVVFGISACLLLVAASVLSGCGVRPQQGTIVIHDLQFDPPSVAVAKGSKVTWINSDQIPVQIQTDSFGTTPTVPGQFSSEPLDPGESFSYTFSDTGTFTYSDPFHPYMTGSVAVK
jgi:plastocyanin